MVHPLIGVSGRLEREPGAVEHLEGECGVTGHLVQERGAAEVLKEERGDAHGDVCESFLFFLFESFMFAF